MRATLELAQLQQHAANSLPAALKAYEKAAGILKKPPHAGVPAELWNNLGSIRHRLGKLETAEQAYNHAIAVARRDGGSEYDAKCITSQRTICAISLSMMIVIDSSCMAKVAPLRGRRARVPTAASDAHD